MVSAAAGLVHRGLKKHRKNTLTTQYSLNTGCVGVEIVPYGSVLVSQRYRTGRKTPELARLRKMTQNSSGVPKRRRPGLVNLMAVVLGSRKKARDGTLGYRSQEGFRAI